MSIVINGIDMPKGNSTEILLIYSDGRVFTGHKDNINCFAEELPSAQQERPEQPESAKEYCAECNHNEVCRWYPYEGCEFRSLPSAQPDTIPVDWIQKYADDWEDMSYAYDNPILGMLEDWRREQDG